MINEISVFSTMFGSMSILGLGMTMVCALIAFLMALVISKVNSERMLFFGSIMILLSYVLASTDLYTTTIFLMGYSTIVLAFFNIFEERQPDGSHQPTVQMNLWTLALILLSINLVSTFVFNNGAGFGDIATAGAKTVGSIGDIFNLAIGQSAPYPTCPNGGYASTLQVIGQITGMGNLGTCVDKLSGGMLNLAFYDVFIALIINVLINGIALMFNLIGWMVFAPAFITFHMLGMITIPIIRFIVSFAVTLILFSIWNQIYTVAFTRMRK